MTGREVVELHEPVYEARTDGVLVIESQHWTGLLVPDDQAETRQAAVEVLQRWAVDVKGWTSYPGSAGAAGPYDYVWRAGSLVRAVRWSPHDRPAGRYWRVTLGVGMSDRPEPLVEFGDPLDLDAFDL